MGKRFYVYGRQVIREAETVALLCVMSRSRVAVIVTVKFRTQRIEIFSPSTSKSRALAALTGPNISFFCDASCNYVHAVSVLLL